MKKLVLYTTTFSGVKVSITYLYAITVLAILFIYYNIF